ncbi:hypothetical protein V1505DRAFT_28307 [Lipomyces doorenjongii]
MNALKKGVELSSHTLRHEYGITNKVDPDTEASRASSYIVPRAINLLAFRPNGTFLNYPQITHIAAAIRYVLRSIMLYNLMAEDDNDDEAAVDSDIAQFLSRSRSSAFHTVSSYMHPVARMGRTASYRRLRGRRTTSQRYASSVAPC